MELTPAVPWNSMELGVHQFRWHEQFHEIPRNSMKLGVRQFRWHEQFHGIPWNLDWRTPSSMEFQGIPWNLECANFADTSSSMKFHGTRSAPISLTRAVPWNSMELGLPQFRWHEQFHGILWSFKCANFADMSSSMEFHGTWSAPISLTRAVPWNSMELQVRQFRWHEQFHGIPWDSMELEGRQFRWHEQFHGIPWNSMELGVRQIWWHEQFHGIPWNLNCASFADTSSSMEFHWTWGAPISLTRAVPWNSMELGVCQFRWHQQFNGILWNSKELAVPQFRWHKHFHGNPWNSIELGVCQFPWHEQFHGIP